jgi:hypothetical protein
MPQLDFGSWFNQTTSLVLGFWILVYVFFFVFLAQGSWLIKVRTKISTLRTLISYSISTQKSSLESEIIAVQMIALSQVASITSSNISSTPSFGQADLFNNLLEETLYSTVEAESLAQLQLVDVDQLDEEEEEETN